MNPQVTEPLARSVDMAARLSHGRLSLTVVGTFRGAAGVYGLMVKRLLLVGVLASVLVAVPAGDAAACSCAALQPAEALAEFDAAFVGRLIERPSSAGDFEEDAPYVFEVEVWVKDDLGPEIIVYAPNQGSACGFEAQIGERVGVLVMVSGGKARGGLCSTVNADLLLAGDQPYAVDGSGPPTFLVAGYDSTARLMLLDSSGGLLATVGEQDQWLGGLTVCPGSESLVELVNDQLVVRRVSDLGEIRRVDLDGLPNRVGVPNIWCRDSSGDEVWLSAEGWAEETGIVFQLLDATDLETPLIEGGYGWMEVGEDFAVAGEGSNGRRIWRIDIDSRQRSVLHEVPVGAGDSPPSGRGWLDPSGQRMMITQWRYRDGSGGSTTLFLYSMDTGELLWESGTLPTADGVGWIDGSTFLVSSYPDVSSDDVEYLLINPDGPEITVLDSVPGWQTLRVGDNLAGVSEASLQIVPLAGGEPNVLRLLPTESHHLVAVVDIDATVTPTTQSSSIATATVPPPAAAEPAPAVAGSGGEPTRSGLTPWLFVTAGVLAVAGIAVVARRRHRTASRGFKHSR